MIRREYVERANFLEVVRMLHDAWTDETSERYYIMRSVIEYDPRIHRVSVLRHEN